MWFKVKISEDELLNYINQFMDASIGCSALKDKKKKKARNNCRKRKKRLSYCLWWNKTFSNHLKKINRRQFIKSCTTSARGITLNWVIFCAWIHPLFMHSGSNILALSVNLCKSYIFLISRDLLSLSRDVVRLLGSWAPGSPGTCDWSLHSDLRSFTGGMWCGKAKPVKIWMQMQDAILSFQSLDGSPIYCDWWGTLASLRLTPW